MPGSDSQNREEPSEPHVSDRLDSWKEIAAYLKRDERTVRRWEELEGLPVHRHQHKSRAAIFAFKSELDAWWDNGRKRLEEQEPAAAASRRAWFPWPAAATAAILAFVGGIYAHSWLRGRSALAHVQSIAVLPLANLSQDAGQDYLADGLTEALTTDLGKLSVLRVISRTSTIQYKGTKKSIPEIARELHVDAVVEGAVLRSGDKVRITAQLIDAPADRHVWAETYDRDLRDVLALQADVARAIAVQIRGKLSSSPQLHGASPLNPEAYELYLKGRYSRDEGTEDGLKLAFAYFRQALERDPQYAPAYAGLADSYARLPFYSETRPEEAFPKAKAAATKALQLDQTVAEAHASMAYVKTYYDWDWAGAEAEFRRGLELNPNYADVHHSYSRFLASLGRVAEARAELKRALAVSGGRGVNSIASLAHAYGLAGQHGEAQKILVELEKRSKKTYVSSYQIALVYLGLGQNDKAMKHLDNAYQEHSTLLTYLKMDPRFDPLRSDPRFQDLVHRVGLSQ